MVDGGRRRSNSVSPTSRLRPEGRRKEANKRRGSKAVLPYIDYVDYIDYIDYINRPVSLSYSPLSLITNDSTTNKPLLLTSTS